MNKPIEKKETPSYYAILPGNVRYDKSLSPSARILYAEITCLTNKYGYCWASNKYFSSLYGVSRSTISSWVNSLVKSGYITVEYVFAEGKNIEERKIYLTGLGKVPSRLQELQEELPPALESPAQENPVTEGGGQIFDQGGQKTRKRILNNNIFLVTMKLMNGVHCVQK